MERIVGEMEEEETEGDRDAIEGVEGGGEGQRDRHQEGVGQDHDDQEDQSEDTVVEHAEIEAQVHRGER